MEANDIAANATSDYDYDLEFDDYKTNLPSYLRITVGIMVTVIFLVGTVGNLMVMMVIASSRSMRSSTNFFLLNLSLADLLVLVFVTPTVLLEVIYTPDIWLLGPVMCKLVPVLELLVCVASVLTIVAISLERYYAICTPLKGLYVCTKGRAVKLCIIIWILAFVFTSPTFFTTYYVKLPTYTADGGEKDLVPMCIVSTGQTWQYIYQLAAILFFFIIPLLLLLTIYRKIVLKMRMDRTALSIRNEKPGTDRVRGQVVYMVGTVVFTFFLCLLPFRLLALAFLLTDFYSYLNSNPSTQEIYYGILYFCRIMIYVNSAVNPILYNVMSTKFRNGFRQLSCKFFGWTKSPQGLEDIEGSVRRTRVYIVKTT